MNNVVSNNTYLNESQFAHFIMVKKRAIRTTQSKLNNDRINQHDYDYFINKYNLSKTVKEINLHLDELNDLILARRMALGKLGELYRNKQINLNQHEDLIAIINSCDSLKEVYDFMLILCDRMNMPLLSNEESNNSIEEKTLIDRYMQDSMKVLFRERPNYIVIQEILEMGFLGSGIMLSNI